MKKLLLLIAVVALAVSCSDCDCPDPGDGLRMHARTFEVLSTDWEYADSYRNDVNDPGLNPHYYCTFNDFDVLTPYVIRVGEVTGSLTTEGGRSPLPYYRVYEEASASPEDPIFAWVQDITYEYSAGKITFFVTKLEKYDIKPPTMYFRIALVW